MSAIKTVVTGGAGRMGRTLLSLLFESDEFEVLGATEREGHLLLGSDIGELAGGAKTGKLLTSDLLDLIRHADAVLDFTSPENSVEVAALAAQARIVHVLGTTGFNAAEDAKIKAAARHATIIRSGNFSVGVVLMAELTKRIASLLDDRFDVEILETHHRAKVDAPSGTALLLGEAAAQGRGIELASHSDRRRDGRTGARETGHIGFASLRGGSVVGEHTVMFIADDERIELKHVASDRSIFARGALRAAKWGQGKGPGLFSMQDVLGLSA
jgi:4-hydroxy-tetrahydrodipicolinate reductase